MCFLIDVNLVSEELILKNSIDFSYIRSKTRILLGKSIKKKDFYVTSEKIKYKSISKFNNSYKLAVDSNYVIKSLRGGVVTFIGNIDSLGKTVTINCDDGTNISYSNLENISVKMYDYIDKNRVLGSTVTDTLYLTFKNSKGYLSYEEYL